MDFYLKYYKTEHSDVNKVVITGNDENLVLKISGQFSATHYQIAFDSWYTLGTTILHKYYHVADYASGFAKRKLLA